MEIFTQFSSDLDENTQIKLAYGKGLMYLLRQPRYQPLSQKEQTVLLVAAFGNVLKDIPFEKIGEFKKGLLEYINKNAHSLSSLLNENSALSSEAKEQIVSLAEEYKRKANL